MGDEAKFGEAHGLELPLQDFAGNIQGEVMGHPWL